LPDSRTAPAICGLDAEVEKVRDGRRVVRERLVVAHAMHETGRAASTPARRTPKRSTALLRCGDARLAGVQLAISDAYQGLKAAVMALVVIASFDPRDIDPP